MFLLLKKKKKKIIRISTLPSMDFFIKRLYYQGKNKNKGNDPLHLSLQSKGMKV